MRGRSGQTAVENMLMMVTLAAGAVVMVGLMKLGFKKIYDPVMVDAFGVASSGGAVSDQQGETDSDKTEDKKVKDSFWLVLTQLVWTAAGKANEVIDGK